MIMRTLQTLSACGPQPSAGVISIRADYPNLSSTPDVHDRLQEVGRVDDVLARLLEVPRDLVLPAAGVGLAPAAHVRHDVARVGLLRPLRHRVVVTVEVRIALHHRRRAHHEVARLEERIVHALVAHVRLHDHRVARAAAVLVAALAPLDAHRRLLLPPLELLRPRLALCQLGKLADLGRTAALGLDLRRDGAAAGGGCEGRGGRGEGRQREQKRAPGGLAAQRAVSVATWRRGDQERGACGCRQRKQSRAHPGGGDDSRTSLLEQRKPANYCRRCLHACV
eukprot:scaffold100174_cov60-Phaeocystis_antarctica.AAC.2